MKTLTLILLFSLLPTLSGWSQPVQTTLNEISIALDKKDWQNAVHLFSNAIPLSVEKAEMYYWTRVDKNCEAATGMLFELGAYYKAERNYDKAYLFYKELTNKHPNEVKYLEERAHVEVWGGKSTDAVLTYEQILYLDPDNLDANIFMGNYYFLLAEQKKERLEKDFRTISSPTRMQVISYRNSIGEIYRTDYLRAKPFLENVVSQFSSTEAKKSLEKIEKMERRMERKSHR